MAGELTPGASQTNSALDDDARRVRLADAYAHWIPVARTKLRDVQQLWNSINYASWHKKGQDLLKERPKLFQIGPLLTDIDIAATNVLLFEHDSALRDRIQALTKGLPPVPNGIGGRHHPAIVALNAAIHQKMLDLEQLIADVAEHLGRPKVRPGKADSTSPNPPIGDSFLYPAATGELTARKSSAMQIVKEPEASERLIVFAPHGSPHDGLGLALEELLDVMATCDKDPTLDVPQFRGAQQVMSNGVVRTSEGNRFGLALDGSFAVRRRLFHDRPGAGRVVQRGDIGLYSSLEQLYVAILYVRKIIKLVDKHIYQWSFRHELHGIQSRHLMNEFATDDRSASDWSVSDACADEIVAFSGEIDLRSTDKCIADLLDHGGVKLAAAFGRHQLVSVLKPGTAIVAAVRM